MASRPAPIRQVAIIWTRFFIVRLLFVLVRALRLDDGHRIGRTGVAAGCCIAHTSPAKSGWARTCYFFSISMPFMEPLPDLVAEQNMASSPHFEQTCFTSASLPLPLPVATTSTVPPQTGHTTFSPTVIILTCALSVVTF